MSAPGWPAQLADGPVGLRPLRLRDAGAWVELRRRNAEWLRPWDPTPPGGEGRDVSTVASAASYTALLRVLRRQARAGTTLPFAVTVEGALAGQLTIGSVVLGSLRGAHAGYWVDRRVAGRGVMPTALALAVDHCFTAVGLHRIEVNIRPENDASRRVVAKLGFREEGMRRRYLHIDGDWRDHLTYALTAEEVPGGLLARWHRARAAPG